MNDNFFKSTLGQLRVVGFVEGISYLVLLCIAMPIKYLAGNPMPVKVVGMIHGVLFVLYVALVILVKFQLKWSYYKTFLALLASLIPLGTFYADLKLFRK